MNQGCFAVIWKTLFDKGEYCIAIFFFGAANEKSMTRIVDLYQRLLWVYSLMQLCMLR